MSIAVGGTAMSQVAGKHSCKYVVM